MQKITLGFIHTQVLHQKNTPGELYESKFLPLQSSIFRRGSLFLHLARLRSLYQRSSSVCSSNQRCSDVRLLTKVPSHYKQANLKKNRRNLIRCVLCLAFVIDILFNFILKVQFQSYAISLLTAL